MAKVKNKKKAFKHRLKKQGLFNNLKAPVPPVPPVAPQLVEAAGLLGKIFWNNGSVKVEPPVEPN